jgi:hypothetical protein
MKYEKAKEMCHVRSSIYRKSNPKVKYPKNHIEPFDVRVPAIDQLANDWEEFDPQDFYDLSLPIET